MAFRNAAKLRSILNGSACIRPGSVYDPTSIRIAEDLGFELGMFGGSVASLAILGDPDITLITLTELCRADAADVARLAPCRCWSTPTMATAMRSMSAAPCRNWRRRAPPASPSRTRCCRRPLASAEPQLISLEEGVGKMKAALDGRSDPSLVIMGRTGTRGGGPTASSFEECVARARAYEATGVDALFFTGLTTRREVEAISAATTLPHRARQHPGRTRRCRVPRQPAGEDRAAGPHAVRRGDAGGLRYAEGAARGHPPKDLKGLASSDTDRPPDARCRCEGAQLANFSD